MDSQRSKPCCLHLPQLCACMHVCVCLCVRFAARRGGFQPTHHSPELSASTLPHQLTTLHPYAPIACMCVCTPTHSRTIKSLHFSVTWSRFLVVAVGECVCLKKGSKVSSAKSSEHLWLISIPTEQPLMGADTSIASRNQVDFQFKRYLQAIWAILVSG